MPSADSAPSLLSRLSPAVPLPGDFSEPSPAQPIAKSPTHRPTYLSSPPAPSFLSGTPPKSSVSPRKGAGFSRSPHAPPHIPALPADVLSKAQPIPANRSTRSSRWAASPPSSPPIARSPLSFGNRAQTFGTSPNGNALSTSAGKTPTASSPALDQIEAMLSQLRTTNPSSSPAKSPTIQSNLSKSPASASMSQPTLPQPDTPHHSPPAPPANVPPPLAAPVQSAPPEAPKKKVLGSRSKWARTGDDEPDEFASLAEKELHSGSNAKQVAEEKPAAPPVLEPVGSVAERPASSARLPAGEKTAPPVVETESQADSPGQAEASFSASPQRRPSVSSTSSSSASQSHHIDWADDDDDELPGLDDWGIETTPATFDTSTPPSPAVPSASPPPSMPPLGARRRSTGRSQKSPPQPSPAPLPPGNRFTAPPSPTKGTPRTPRGPPAKPPARLFASARAALATPPHLAAAASTHNTPTAFTPVAQAEEGSWRDRKPRTPGGPGSALFSRAFSGISPAAGSPATPAAASVSPAAEAASKGRRSRGGKARNKGGAGGGAAGGAKAGGAGAGAQTSKWA